MNKYVERLVREWKKERKIIISVDYDSTISYWPSIENQEDIERAIKLIQLAYAIGAYITIFTASDIEKFEEIQSHCEKIKIPVHSINSNPISLPYGNHGKIYYNINLCDRSGLREALDILDQAIDIMQEEKHN